MPWVAGSDWTDLRVRRLQQSPLVMAHELAVWLFAEQVGTLALVDGRLSFAYHPNWLANPDAVALSCSLPLQAAPFDDIRTRPFFGFFAGSWGRAD